MEEAIAETPETVQHLIDVVPYAGAVAVLLIIMCVFIVWVLKQQGRRDDVILSIIRENTAAQSELKESIKHLIDLCHLKITGEGGG